MNDILRVKSLNVRYGGNGAVKAGKRDVLRDISFCVESGEILAVVGESGSGKSTLCRAVMGFLPQSAECGGEIEYRGENILSCGEDRMCALRGSELAMVFQDPMTALDPTMSVGRQISEAIAAHNKNLSRGELRERAVELLERVGIDHPRERVKQYPYQFSGGMRQRIVIAIAIASQPKLLLADEPTTALDVTKQRQILELLRELNRSTGMAILLISHDLAVVAQVADRAAIINEGRIVELGTVEEIFRDPQHEYTKKLLEARRKLSEERE